MASSSAVVDGRSVPDGVRGLPSLSASVAPTHLAGIGSRSGRAAAAAGDDTAVASSCSSPVVPLPGRASRKRPAAPGPESDPVDSDSTEYVPVAERGWRGSPPVVDDAGLQPHRLLKRQRRLAREDADRRVRLLGARILEAYGRAAVDGLWEAAGVALDSASSSTAAPSGSSAS